MISEQDVQHVAKLARIGIRDQELEKFQKELGAILNYVKELQEVDTKDIEPASHVTGAENVMRDDKVREETPEEVRKKLVEMAPDKKGGYVKTKPIL